MALPTSMTDFTSLFSLFGHKRLAQLASALLLVYIAFVFAGITWSITPQTQSNQNALFSASTKGSNGNSTKKTIDVAKIQSLNLFGLYNENEIESIDTEASDVPETTLNLTLSGLVASDDKSTAAAIIESKGKQETYGIGDIIIGTRANLEQVLMDRVLIKRAGKLETLMLDGFDYAEPAQNVTNKKPSRKSKKKSRSPKANVVDQRNNKALSQTAKNLRSELSTDPAKIGDYLRISPKRKGNNIVGYSLRPGKKPEFFKLAGLKSGDVAVQMNGHDLTETAQAMQAMVEMKQESAISLLIDRQGSLTEILISL